MAINLLNEDNEVRCEKCDSNIFKEVEWFTLKTGNENIKYVKDIIVKDYICDVCGDIVYTIKTTNNQAIK